MGRELPVLVDRVVRARRYKFTDFVIVTLPLQAGDISPIVIRAAKRSFVMQTRESFVVFTLLVFLGVLDRMPFPEEQDDWTSILEELSRGDFETYIAEVKTRIA